MKEDRSEGLDFNPSGPPHHAHNNTTTISMKKTKYTQINTNKSMQSEMGPA